MYLKRHLEVKREGKMKIVYLILHYLAGMDTIECVESILQATNESEHENIVLVVDNGSENSSYTDLKMKFKDENRVVLLRNSENLGFARGNNVGFVYAKNELKADFIVQLNNDTIINQKDFSEILVNKFHETGYSVLGPDILTADGFHQNPGDKQFWTFSELLVFRIKRKIENLLYYFKLGQLRNKIVKVKGDVYRKNKLEKEKTHTILHGACLIFSPLYIRKFNGMCDKTFLYWEEDILKLYADFYGFLMLYSPQLEIYHKEDAATNMQDSIISKREIRKNRYIIQSLDIYCKEKIKFIIKECRRK